MKLINIWWALFRIFSYVIVLINILSFGTFLYLIAPYTSYFFFKDLRFWKYLGLYHKYYFQTLSYIKLIFHKDRAIFWADLPLTSPPMDGPHLSKFRIVKSWKFPSNSCGECCLCCELTGKCCFYDKSEHKCMCYGSLFWKFFNCGRFPSTKKRLEYFKCPKFESI